jgi:hypothetical protein
LVSNRTASYQASERHHPASASFFDGSLHRARKTECSPIDRLESRQLLTLAEVEEDANKCKLTLQELRSDTDGNVIRLSQKGPGNVDTLTAGIRLHAIRRYLDWLTKERLLRIGPTHPHFEGLRAISEIVLGAIDARTPDGVWRNTLEAREGVAPATLERLADVIYPRSPENPWKNAHAQLRNYLIVRCLLSLGIRRVNC